MTRDLQSGLARWQARTGPSGAARAEQASYQDFLALHGLPDTADAVALYLVHLVDTRGTTLGGIRYRLRLLDLAAILDGADIPSHDATMRLFMRGMHRALSNGRDEGRTPLYLEDVDALLHAIDRDRYPQLRDAAFVLLVDAAPLPVTLIRQLSWHQVRLRRDHVQLDIPAQRGARWATGKVVIPSRDDDTCPLRAITRLSRHAGPANGYVFAGRAGQPPSMSTAELLLADLSARDGTWCGSVPRQPSAGPAILAPLLARLLADRPRQQRDRALITLSFSACLRPDEARGLRVGDVQRCSDGLVLRLRGRPDVGIPFAKVGERCPVTLWERWLAELTNHGGGERHLADHVAFPRIQQRMIATDPLPGSGLSWTVRERCAQAGLTGDFGFTSLRIGFMRSAARAGVPEQLICQQAGLRRLDSALLHVRREQLLSHNAAALVGL